MVEIETDNIGLGGDSTVIDGDIQDIEIYDSADAVQEKTRKHNLCCIALCDEYQDEIIGIEMDVARLIPEELAKRFCLVAVGETEDIIVLAMTNPVDVIAKDTIGLRLGKEVKVVTSSEQEIRKAIDAIYHGVDVEEQGLREIVELERRSEESDSIEDDYESEATKPPVIRFVDLLLSQAIKKRASDIHFEPQENSMIIRMRIDGVLHKVSAPPRSMQSAVVARIKIMSIMDISERRLPQDGRFRIKFSNRHVDFRVSTIPTQYGEKVVMRILDGCTANHDINQLGFRGELLGEFKQLLSRPHGMIIVTGPTGSGKSTTLYAALNHLKDPSRNIVTVENPIEFSVPEVNQVQVNSEIGLDFALCLRTILRQDPDTILIGEIRDKETVDIAMKASLTGHMVLSTFHTNDAPSAISRLVHMGVEPYLLASALNLVIAQRLVRKVCEHCKEPVELSEEVLERLKISHTEADSTVFYGARGCDACEGTGYLGRVPIFEFLVMDEDICDQLIEGATESQIRTMSRQKGYEGLLASGVERLRQGLTTAEEVLKHDVSRKGKK